MKALMRRSWVWAILAFTFGMVGLFVDYRYSIVVIFFEFLWVLEVWFWASVRRREKAEK